MEGVQYVTDENNRKIAIQISYEKYGDLIEDLLDRMIIESRRNEESYPINEVISELKEKERLDRNIIGSSS